MDILQTVEDYLARNGTPFDPSASGKNIVFGMGSNGKPVSVKVQLSDDNILHFKWLLPIKTNKKKAKEILLAINFINGYVRAGKFVMTGNSVYYDITLFCQQGSVKEKEVEYYLQFARQVVNDHLLPLDDLNTNKLKLSKFLTGVYN